MKHNRKVLEKTIYKSCLIKKEIVEKDEKEKNIRKVLNLGHTFAHAYEATVGYNRSLVACISPNSFNIFPLISSIFSVLPLNNADIT